MHAVFLYGAEETLRSMHSTCNLLGETELINYSASGDICC